MVVAIVIAAVIIVLIVIMKWADRRDRAKGHVNRGFGEISSTLRASRLNTRTLRSRGGRQGAVSPHEFARRLGRRPGQRDR